MAQTPPPVIDPVPTPPIQRGDRTTFSSRVDAFITWLVSAVPQIGGAAAATYTNAVDAFNNATTAVGSANTAVSAVGNFKWNSATNYSDGAVVWSPIDRRTYRRTSAGTSAIDPSADSANWVLISQEPGIFLVGSAVIASNVASINFLSAFPVECTSLIIEVEGLVPSAPSSVGMRVAVGGVAISSINDYTGGATEFLLSGGNSVAADNSKGLSSTIRISNARAAQMKKVYCESLVPTPTPSYVLVQSAIGVLNTGVVTGFQIYPIAAGVTFTRGTVRIYAYRTR